MKTIDLKTIDRNSPSPYFSSRGGHEINSIIIHSTQSENFKNTVAGFANNQEKISTHFVISREGVIKQIVDPDKVANHSGGFRPKPADFDKINTKFKATHNGKEIPVGMHNIHGVVQKGIPKSNINGDFNVNMRSIGIELMNSDDGKQQFTGAQLQALEGLIAALIIEYPNISIDQIYGHVDISRDPDAKDFGHTTYGHTDDNSDHTDPKPNFPFDDVKEAIIALFHDIDTPVDANFTSPDGKDLHLPDYSKEFTQTPSDANMTNEHGEEVHVDSNVQQSNEINYTPGDANTSLPDGQMVHYDGGNQTDNSQQTHSTDANMNLPDGATVYHGADSNQTDQSSDSNMSLPDGATVHHGAESNQIDHSQQTLSTDSNMSLPDGATVHHGADSNQIELNSLTEFASSQWFDPYHHAPIVNHVNPFNSAVHHGADSNQIDHSQQAHSTDTNMSLPDGATVHHGADSNQIDHSQQTHSTDANMSLPDGAIVHHSADSNQIDHSQQTQSTDQGSSNQIDSHQNQVASHVAHDDGNQSMHP